MIKTKTLHFFCLYLFFLIVLQGIFISCNVHMFNYGSMCKPFAYKLSKIKWKDSAMIEFLLFDQEKNIGDKIYYRQNALCRATLKKNYQPYKKKIAKLCWMGKEMGMNYAKIIVPKNLGWELRGNIEAPTFNEIILDSIKIKVKHNNDKNWENLERKIEKDSPIYHQIATFGLKENSPYNKQILESVYNSDNYTAPPMRKITIEMDWYEKGVFSNLIHRRQIQVYKRKKFQKQTDFQSSKSSYYH